jgi:hypothetical protein
MVNSTQVLRYRRFSLFRLFQKEVVLNLIGGKVTI